MLKIILIIGSYQVLVFAVFLLVGPKTVNSPNRILGLFFGGLFIHHFARLVLEVSPAAYQYVEFFTFPAALVLFPLFYSYIRQIIGQDAGRNTVLHHLSPAIIFGLLYIPLYGLMPQTDKLLYFQMSYLDILLRGVHHYPAAIMAVVGLFFVVPIQACAYTISSVRLLMKHRHHLHDNFSAPQEKSLTWVLVMIALFFLMSVIGIIMVLTGTSDAEFFYFLVALPVYAAIGLFGITQPRIYPTQEIERHPSILPAPAHPANERATGSSTTTSKTMDCDVPLKLQLADYFSRHHPYLNADLGIQDIALALSTNTTYISRTLNDGYGVNFYTYVNKFRINAAKKLLQDPSNEKYSIDGIAEKSGFRSLSAFYAAFKQIEGVTPASFRNKTCA